MKSLIRSSCYFATLCAAHCLVSCGESPEVLRIEAETADLSETVKVGRQEIQTVSDLHRELRDQQRKLRRSTELDDLEAEVQVLRDRSAEAAADLEQTKDDLEAMKGARLP